MINYPVHFIGESNSKKGILTTWSTKSSGIETICCVPEEFEGSGGALAPEDHFLLALINCFVATFKVYSHYSKLEFDHLNVRGELCVDFNDDKKPIMKELMLKINIQGPSDIKKANLLINKALENGFILNSTTTKINHEVIFS